MKDELIQELKKLDLGKVLTDVSLKDYTTYKVGGIAKCVIYPKNVDCLVAVINKLKANSVTYMVLGCGSNVLFSDSVYDGVIIKLDEFNKIQFNGTRVEAGAGASLMKVAYQSVRKGLTGLEFATGIPGMVGASIAMNAGAYKSDIASVVETVTVVNPDNEIVTMRHDDLNFSYRNSFFKENKGYYIVSATLKLTKGKKEEILEKISKRRVKRIETQPLDMPSAGSVFRNPEGMYAGELIEKIGLKGYKLNGAMVSENMQTLL